MVYLGMRWMMPAATPLSLGLAAVLFSWSVEFSQLYHAPWIDEIRDTRLGALVLGSIFNWPDLVAYLVGVGFGGGLEAVFGATDGSTKEPRR
jgi:hypothetical protein